MLSSTFTTYSGHEIIATRDGKKAAELVGITWQTNGKGSLIFANIMAPLTQFDISIDGEKKLSNVTLNNVPKPNVERVYTFRET